MEQPLTRTRGAANTQVSSRVSAIVVTWNSARYLRRCLAGLANQTQGDLELIVVDNASDDDSVSIAKSLFADCRVIRNDSNRGFSAAVNQGVAVASGGFILLCNPDAYLEPAYVERLVDALHEMGEKFGAATGTLMQARGDDITPTELVDTKGIRMTRSGRHFDVGQGRRDGEDDRGLRPLAGARGSSVAEVFGVSGAAAMFRTEFVHDVSVDGEFLDEDFFAYREDADVAWRGRLFGWRALSVGSAIGAHIRRVTPERRGALPAFINMHSVKNRFLLRWKNEGRWLALRNAPFELTRDLVTIAAVATIERSSLPALRWLWTNRRRIAAKRAAVQSRRRVSDRELGGWFR